MTLTFDLLASKSNHFYSQLHQFANLVKFPQAACKIRCSQTSSIWSRTHGQAESKMPSTANRRRRHKKTKRVKLSLKSTLQHSKWCALQSYHVNQLRQIRPISCEFHKREFCPTYWLKYTELNKGPAWRLTFLIRPLAEFKADARR